MKITTNLKISGFEWSSKSHRKIPQKLSVKTATSFISLISFMPFILCKLIVKNFRESCLLWVLDLPAILIVPPDPFYSMFGSIQLNPS